MRFSTVVGVPAALVTALSYLAKMGRQLGSGQLTVIHLDTLGPDSLLADLSHSSLSYISVTLLMVIM